MMAIVVRRLAAAILTVCLTAIGVMLFYGVVGSDGFDVLDAIRLVLLALSSGWLAWGACTAFIGLLFPVDVAAFAHGRDEPEGRVAVLVPIYNEDATVVFANVMAMYHDLAATGFGAWFDFHILSDSTRPERAAEELRLFRAIVTRYGVGNRIFYRHRSPNAGRKAGNIKSFVTASGGAYTSMLVLDADSLMRGETILEMVRRMDGDPELGLLQTVPVVIGRTSLFGRALQFSSAFYSPIFSRGVSALQGRDGPFWGHNALIRVRAFAESCGLPSLPGKPPFGGDVLSHDFVEAALLARAGWKVRLDPDLVGSYEEAPANLLEYAKRDRRWCQGNLQHSRVLPTEGLPFWSRVALVQGILAYLASPMWLLFLVTSLTALIVAPAPVYFPTEGSGVPIFPYPETGKAIALIIGIVALLILPKALMLVRALWQEDLSAYRGRFAVFVGSAIELVLSSVIAPINMMFQSRSVMQVLMGRDAGWPAANRADGSVRLATGFAASWWMMLAGGIGALLGWFFAPKILIWLWPIAVPLIFAPLVISWTASPLVGRIAMRSGLFATPAETGPEAVIRRAEAFAVELAGEGEDDGATIADFTTARAARPQEG
ncbi:MAG: glucans biosynthesis glucosyltransferase MdoH [Hyphomicrobiales bacterium]|nr:MAG: glucans biosynthesis glucosyltransferase MdoH [Hyphomicrobiales bacterium]